MSTPLARASLVPLDAKGESPVGEPIALDFNPETLSIQQTASLAATKGSSQAAAESTKASSQTLTLTVLFDSTRPTGLGDGGSSGGAGLSVGVSAGFSAGASLSAGASASASVGVSAGASVGVSAGASVGLSVNASLGVGGGGGGGEEALDVRLKTQRIFALIRSQDPNQSGSAGSSGQGQPSGTLVRFEWGAIKFTAILRSASETLEYFSASGVPLRSRVELTLEQAQDLSDLSGSKRRSFNASVGAGASLGLGFSAGLSLGLSAGIDLGFSAGAGLSLSAGAGLDVFGGSALSGALGADADLSQSGGGALRSGSSSPPATPTAWAPSGPAAGSAAAANAAVVAATRAAGGAGRQADPASGSFTATRIGAASAAAAPSSSEALASAAAQSGTLASQVVSRTLTAAPAQLPILGAPPRAQGLKELPPPPAVFTRVRASEEADRVGLPRWMALSDAPAAPRARSSKKGGCGCGGGC